MSAKVFKLNNEEAISRLKSWAESLSRNKNVLGVILFGSLVKREATPASDADIVILLRESKEKFDDRIPRFIPEKIGLSVDVFPYTIEEFQSSLNENWGIAKEALDHGILLYGIQPLAPERQSIGEWFQNLLRKS